MQTPLLCNPESINYDYPGNFYAINKIYQTCLSNLHEAKDQETKFNHFWNTHKQMTDFYKLEEPLTCILKNDYIDKILKHVEPQEQKMATEHETEEVFNIQELVPVSQYKSHFDNFKYQFPTEQLHKICNLTLKQRSKVIIDFSFLVSALGFERAVVLFPDQYPKWQQAEYCSETMRKVLTVNGQKEGHKRLKDLGIITVVKDGVRGCKIKAANRGSIVFINNLSKPENTENGIKYPELTEIDPADLCQDYVIKFHKFLEERRDLEKTYVNESATLTESEQGIVLDKVKILRKVYKIWIPFTFNPKGMKGDQIDQFNDVYDTLTQGKG